MNIPDEAVEAAAKVVREKGLYSNYYPTFDALRAALEAAAPLIAAETWHLGYVAGKSGTRLRNPYRPVK